MNGAIYLDYQSRLGTIEIDDESIDRVLAAELNPRTRFPRSRCQSRSSAGVGSWRI